MSTHIYIQQQRHIYKTLFVTFEHKGTNTWATPILHTHVDRLHSSHRCTRCTALDRACDTSLVKFISHLQGCTPGKAERAKRVKKKNLSDTNSYHSYSRLLLLVYVPVYPSGNNVTSTSITICCSNQPAELRGRDLHRGGHRSAACPFRRQGCRGGFHATDWWPNAHTSTAANDSNR